MYGTRGANGVLIIKTKSGSDLEKPIIGVRVEAYVNTPIKRPKTVDGVTFMRMYNEAVTNQGTGDALYSDDKIYGTANNLNPYIYRMWIGTTKYSRTRPSIRKLTSMFAEVLPRLLTL